MPTINQSINQSNGVAPTYIFVTPSDFQPLPYPFVLYAPWTGGSFLFLGLGQPWPCLDLLPLLPLLFGIAFHLQLVLLSCHPIFLHPYNFLKLVSFLGANRTKSASFGPRPKELSRDAIQVLEYNTTQYKMAYTLCLVFKVCDGVHRSTDASPETTATLAASTIDWSTRSHSSIRRFSISLTLAILDR